GQTAKLAHVFQILGYAEVVIETENLRQVSDLGTSFARGMPQHDDLTRCCRHHTAENLKRGRLSRSIRSNQAKDLAMFDREVDAANGFYRAVTFMEAGDRNGVFTLHGHCDYRIFCCGH